MNSTKKEKTKNKSDHVIKHLIETKQHYLLALTKHFYKQGRGPRAN